MSMVSGPPPTRPISSSYSAAAASTSALVMDLGALSVPQPISSIPPWEEPKVEHIAGMPSTPLPETGEEGVGVPRPLESLHSTPIPPFLSKTYDLVSDPKLDSVVSWAPAGESFVVWDPSEFSRAVLPRHFKHSNFSSFVRQLNTYVGIANIHSSPHPSSGAGAGLDLFFRWEFANEDFLREKRFLLKNISRHRSSQVPQISTELGSSSNKVKPELDNELQKLRREKNLLMQEAVRLKQDQLMTVQQMDTLNQRMQSAEQRQKQMISFLAKLLQNPVFFAHLKQQKEQRDIASRVRRKFLRHHQSSQCDSKKLMEQQIVRYRPNLADFISSSALQGIEHGTDDPTPDHVLQEMIAKVDIDPSRQESLGGAGEPGDRMLDPAIPYKTAASLEGNDLVSFQPDVSFSGSEYFVSSPEDTTAEKIFSDAFVPSSDSMPDSKSVACKGKSIMNFETDATYSSREHQTSFLNPEDISQEEMNFDPVAAAITEDAIWHTGFEAEGSSLNSGYDVWEDLHHFDAQGLEVASGPCALWDFGLETVEEGLEIDNYMGAESSSQEPRNEARVPKEDHSEHLEP